MPPATTMAVVQVAAILFLLINNLYLAGVVSHAYYPYCRWQRRCHYFHW